MISAGLRRRRLDIIEEHLNTEVTKEFDRSLPTFNGHGCSDHSAYIPIPTGSICGRPLTRPSRRQRGVRGDLQPYRKRNGTVLASVRLVVLQAIWTVSANPFPGRGGAGQGLITRWSRVRAPPAPLQRCITSAEA